MRRIILRYGLIAGSILAAMLVITIPFQDALGFDWGAVVGYTTMVLAFLLIFAGVKSYRDTVAGGRITFGRALGVGALIAVVASACYVVTWEVIYFNRLGGDFGARYEAEMLRKARESGASAADLAARKAELAEQMVMYDKVWFNAAVTFLEPLPTALVISLITAGILSRKQAAP